jgi:hypothetical protein
MKSVVSERKFVVSVKGLFKSKIRSLTNANRDLSLSMIRLNLKIIWKIYRMILFKKIQIFMLVNNDKKKKTSTIRSLKILSKIKISIKCLILINIEMISFKDKIHIFLIQNQTKLFLKILMTQQFLLKISIKILKIAVYNFKNKKS